MPRSDWLRNPPLSSLKTVNNNKNDKLLFSNTTSTKKYEAIKKWNIENCTEKINQKKLRRKIGRTLVLISGTRVLQTNDSVHTLLLYWMHGVHNFSWGRGWEEQWIVIYRWQTKFIKCSCRQSNRSQHPRQGKKHSIKRRAIIPAAERSTFSIDICLFVSVYVVFVLFGPFLSGQTWGAGAVGQLCRGTRDRLWAQ